jgi:hypothetical protein
VEYVTGRQSDNPGRFKVIREMCGTREFRLVLCADVLDTISESAVQELERLVDVERENGRLDCLVCEPLIISEVRVPRTRPCDVRTGDSSKLGILSSAL